MTPGPLDAAPDAVSAHPAPSVPEPGSHTAILAADAELRSAGAILELLVDRMFLRALQFVLGGVLFGVLFLPVRGRGSLLDLATAAVLLALASAALACRHGVLTQLRAHPRASLLFPVPALIAVTLDGGFDSVWTPLVAITVGVPATLGLPWLSLTCALLTASGQAAAWIKPRRRAQRPAPGDRASVPIITFPPSDRLFVGVQSPCRQHANSESKQGDS